jgi:replicative DNA helicase
MSENEEKVLKLPFDERFLITLLELMLNDKHVAEQSYLFLTPELFPLEIYGTFYSMLKTLNEKNSFPSANQLKNEISKITDPKKSQLLIAIFKRITEPRDFRDYDYVKDHLQAFFKQRVIYKMTNDIIKNQTSHPDTLEKIMSKYSKELDSINLNQLKTRTLDNLIGFLEESAEDSKNMIPTFLPTIDEALGGGVPRGTMSLTIGGTNVGKSIWLVNWTYHLIKHKFKVLYINLEGFEKQTMQRLISRAIRARTYHVRNNMLTDYQKDQVINFEHECRESFMFYHNDSFDMTVETLLPSITHIKKNVFDFDVLMVDYGQLLKSKRNVGELRHEQAYCHRALTTLASALNVHVATVAQGTRDTNNKNNSGSSLTRMTDISECFEINRAAATVFTLNRSEKDEEMDRIKILMDKQRDGKKGIVEFCKTDFSTVAMWGTADEGLGFMNQQAYLTETNQKAV